jgi:hypothetical protein
MIDQKKMFEDSSNFFIKETDRIIELISKTKSEKKRISYINQLMYLKNRIALELAMLEKFEENS